jgi:hypothetical protein
LSNAPQRAELAILQLEKPEVGRARPIAVISQLWRGRANILLEVIALIVFAGLIALFVRYGIPMLTEL